MFRRVSTFVISVCFLAAPLLPGQVLARPGWAGSGVAPESWWPRAVFYRVDPTRFQDGDGDGLGDLPGLAHRLDYLQSLGVDALLLDSSSAASRVSELTSTGSSAHADAIPPGELGDLVHEASRHQLRVLLTVTPAMLRGPRPALLQTVHDWMGAGAAGIFVPKPAGLLSGEGEYASLLTSLSDLMRSFPGERVLLSDPAPEPVRLSPPPARQVRRIDPGSFAAGRDGHLVTAALFSVRGTEIAQLRANLASAGQDVNPGTYGLLQFAQPPATGSPNAIGDAALLLASRGAAVLDFGEELGLDLYPSPSVPRPSTAGEEQRVLPLMQWTPSNRTPAQPQAGETKPAAPSGETQFGAYHPYQPPPRDLRAPLGASAVKITPDMNLPVALPDANSLPGFSSAETPPVTGDVAARNTTSEDRDPRSLLNAYRTLIALHHGNAALRNGAQVVLNHDAENALVWVRRPPAGARTVLPVLGAINRSDKPVTLALDSELDVQGLHGGVLRALYRSSTESMTGESTSALFLPPHGVFLGELIHGNPGRGSEKPAPRVRRSRRHRVRR